MKEIIVKNIDNEKFNPFGASDEELIANALDEAGLIKSSTKINSSLADETRLNYLDKRENYKKSTKLGNMLVINKVITQAQLQKALEYQKANSGMKVGEALTTLSICTIEDIENTLSNQSNIRHDIEDLDEFTVKINTIRQRLAKYMPF